MKNIKTYASRLNEEQDVQLKRQLNRDLLYAIVNETPDVVIDLLNRGADANAGSDSLSKQTGLHDVMLDDDVEIARILIDRGANVEVEDVNRQRPIHWAAFNGATKCTKLLLDMGANPNPKNNAMNTPLDFAIAYDHPDVAKLLMNAGVHPFPAFGDEKEMIDFFGGDLDWWNDAADDLRSKAKRIGKTRSMFNR